MQQGVAPILFSVFINSLLKGVEQGWNWLLADDFVGVKNYKGLLMWRLPIVLNGG